MVDAHTATTTPSTKDVLVVDDNAADIALLNAVFRDLALQHRLHVAQDGVEALSFLHREGRHAHAPRPDIILLDLNLPKLHGRDVLQQLKQHDALRSIPVMVLSSSAAESDVVESYARGANAYLVKPFQLDDFVDMIRVLIDFWCTRVVTAPH
jgi:CheY-like chemotaxis protein